jgi:hypothetical protein
MAPMAPMAPDDHLSVSSSASSSASLPVSSPTPQPALKLQLGTTTYLATVEYDPLVQLYVGTIPTIPGAHTQGATLDELRQNLEEVLGLCLAE